MRRVLAITVVVVLGGMPAMAGEAEVIGPGLLAVDGQPIRLLGVAPPDPSELCKDREPADQAATRSCAELGDRLLQRLVSNVDVQCEGTEGPRFGDRVTATCFAAGLDLGRELVRRGLARVDHVYSSRYTIEQEQARRAGRGLWQGAQGAAQ